MVVGRPRRDRSRGTGRRREDPAGQHGVAGADVLAHDGQTEPIEAVELVQAGRRQG